MPSITSGSPGAANDRDDRLLAANRALKGSAVPAISLNNARQAGHPGEGDGPPGERGHVVLASRLLQDQPSIAVDPITAIFMSSPFEAAGMIEIPRGVRGVSDLPGPGM